LKRRALLGASVTTAILAPALSARANPANTYLIYVGGWDCGPCITWKKDKKGPFLASPLARKVKYVEVESPKLREAYQPSYWPSEVKFVRDLIPEKQRSGTPRFLIVRDGALVSNEWGSGEWDRTVAYLQRL
jgi:hypothetical protein